MNFEIDKLGKGIALASLLAASGSVLAAADGSLGTTSTGSLDVLVDIADLVRISNLNDIDLGVFDGTANLTGSDDFCVYRNGTGNYRVTVNSANEDAGSFRVSNGADFIAYSVKFNDVADVTHGQVISATGHASSLTCGGTPNATLEVNMLATDMEAAAPGDYSDTITLLVEPE